VLLKQVLANNLRVILLKNQKVYALKDCSSTNPLRLLFHKIWHVEIGYLKKVSIKLKLNAAVFSRIC
jgi:hypothetical protein